LPEQPSPGRPLTEEEVSILTQSSAPKDKPLATKNKSVKELKLLERESKLNNLNSNQALARVLIVVSMLVLLAINVIFSFKWTSNPDSDNLQIIVEKSFTLLQSVLLILLGYLFGKSGKSE